ncbi:hypothetical protein ABZU45_36270 [Streptomyces avermitilis]|uniref:hypothetical protein n=1 Tax=Streptomyces avermitilis TaxID=33903 RepID=UPI0033B74E14
MSKIRDNKPAVSCVGCFAWGQLPGRFCRACYTYGQLAIFLRRVKHQQLFFANLQRPRNGGPPVGKQGRRVLKRAPGPASALVMTG